MNLYYIADVTSLVFQMGAIFYIILVTWWCSGNTLAPRSRGP